MIQDYPILHDRPKKTSRLPQLSKNNKRMRKYYAGLRTQVSVAQRRVA